MAEPGAIATLRNRGVGDVSIRISINDQLVVDNAAVQHSQSNFEFDASLFSAITNTVDVSFWLSPSAEGYSNAEHQLASASVVVPTANAGSTLTLPPLQFRYADTDRDSIADIHEWMVSPIDIDLDNLVNSEDPDSDNDGQTDQNDETPYGESLIFKPTTSLPAISVEFSNNTTIALPFEPGSQSFISGNVSIPVREPADWPFNAGVFPAESIASRYIWNIVDIESYVLNVCPDWRQGLGTSSFQSTINGTALLYFSATNSADVFVPLTSGSVDSLRGLTTVVPSQLSGAELTVQLDETLKGLVIAPLSTGWISLWSEPSFSGNVCSINLTNLQEVFQQTNTI